jgi:ribosomal protein S17E
MEKDKILSYTAGMLESSGNIGFRKDKRTENSVYPVVTLRSFSSENLKRIKEIFGGSIIKKGKRWELVLSHRKAEKLLKEIYNFLIFRKNEADIVFEIYSDRFTKKYESERKKEIVKKMLKLRSFRQKNLKNGKSSVFVWLED